MYRYKRKRRGATLISRVLAVARKMSPISRAFAETKGKIGGGGWKRRQKFPSRSSWRNMSETKAATESQLAKQRARNAMEKARGRWGGRKGGGERERVGEKEKGRRIVGGFLGGLLLQFLPLSSLRHSPLPSLFFAFSRAQTRGEGGGGPRSRASVYLPWPNAIVCSQTRHTLVCIFSMATTDGISFDSRESTPEAVRMIY